MDYKKIFVQDVKGNKMYFAKKMKSVFDLISVEKLGEDDYSYWQVEIPISHFKNDNLDSEEFKYELHEKLSHSNTYEMEGCSCRGDKTIFRDLKENIPKILTIARTEL